MQQTFRGRDESGEFRQIPRSGKRLDIAARMREMW
jgi:hypothetical protein